MPQVRFRILREQIGVAYATVEFFQDGIATAIASAVTDYQGLSWVDLPAADYKVYVTIDLETVYIGRYVVKAELPLHLSGQEVVGSVFPRRFQMMRYINSSHAVTNTSQYAEWSV